MEHWLELFQMVVKIISRRRRLIANVLTFSFILYLLWRLSTNGSAGSVVKPKVNKQTLILEPVLPDVQDELSRLFKRADTTFDGKVSKKELTWAISRSVEAHIMSALKNNFKNFFSLDKVNHNGQVEWDEWLQDFNHRMSLEKEEVSEREIKERIAAAKAAWSEAARSNPDALNIDEFLAFTHPESSHSSLAQEAEELFSRHDADGDGILTEKEFITNPFIEYEPEELEIRRKTFRTGMDANNDGNADKREILTYLDPKHPFRSAEEADRLIELADTDQDGLLDLDEILLQSSEFLNSRWISPQKVFHGELWLR